MRKTTTLALVVLFTALAALAHAGHSHDFLGVVKAVEGNQLVVTTRAGQDVTFVVNDKTAFLRDGKPAKRSELVTGMRVAVHVGEDHKTATTVKLGSR